DRRTRVGEEPDHAAAERRAARGLEDLERGDDAFGIVLGLELDGEHLQLLARHLTERVRGGGALLVAGRAQALAQRRDHLRLAQGAQRLARGRAYVGLGVTQ